MGSGYVIEHCISAISERKECDRYREYVAEGIRVISENLVVLTRVSYVSKTYEEFVKLKIKVEQTEKEDAPGTVTEKIKSKFR